METESINQFYVYAHRRATDGQIFYIGKGCGERAWSKRNRNTYWRNTVKKYGLAVEILTKGLSEEAAFDLERKMIAEIGREKLCNLTDGGDGTSGHVHSAEVREKIREITKARLSRPETKARMSEAQTGRKHSSETLEKIRAAHLGKLRSAESVAKSAAAKRGKPHSEESKARMSAAHKGRKHSAEAIQKMRDKANARRPETIQKQVASNTGKKRSEEAKRNMAKAQPGKPITCSNGMRFEKTIDAVRWVRENGCPKASVSALTRACQKLGKLAYGFTWAHD